MGVSLRHCLNFVRVIDTVRNRRPLALHGSVSAFFAHRVRKLLHITQNPKQSLNSTETSTPIPYPHKPHHTTIKKLPLVCQSSYNIAPPPHQQGSNATNAAHPTTKAREPKRPTLTGKNSPGWWAGCGCVV